MVSFSGLSAEETNQLTEECDSLINHVYMELDLLEHLGCVIEPWNCGYFDTDTEEEYKSDSKVYSELRADLAEQVSSIILETIPNWCAQLLPTHNQDGNARLYLCNEQYVVKPPDTGSRGQFEWHQDSQYMPEICRSVPSVTCWVTLDKVNEVNGAICIEPYPAVAQTFSVPSNVTEYVKHHHQLASQYPDKYPFEISTGCLNISQYPNLVFVDLEPGSIVFMSGQVRHCSISNRSSKFRRVFLPQYTSLPVLKAEFSHEDINTEVVDTKNKLLALAVPCELEQ
ncbi:hypothetical protein K7432_001607 [Basidiobolus ranarum]|uniref:Phytanoyl-CoA dioxygenase n=1 Tax=Basidiobolus ranarum TaxID=34480 RepID=A0ABR2X332_9FUNG